MEPTNKPPRPPAVLRWIFYFFSLLFYLGCFTQIVKEKSLSLTGIVGIFPAATVDGEDVEVYANESR